MVEQQIRIRRAVPADVPAIVDVHFTAFNQGPMTRTLHPGGVSAEARLKFGNSLFPSRSPDPATAGEAIVMVAELVPLAKEKDLPPEAAATRGAETQVIAFAKWTVHRQPRREDQWNTEKAFTAEELGEGADVEVFEVFLGGLNRMRKRWMRGDPGVELNILACAPAYSRLGAGSGLLRWGTELADQEGLIAWLEASPLGFRLYERFGFKAVEVQDLAITERWKAVPREGEDWGTASATESFGPLAPGWFRTVMMKRSPNRPVA